MSTSLPPFTGDVLLHDWHFRPVWSAVILALLLAYLSGLVLARRRGAARPHPARVASFVAALLVLLLSLSSAVDIYSHLLFWDHMVQHLLLIMVVPALLVAGHPLTLLTGATRGLTHATVRRMLRSGPVAVLTHPLVGLALYTAIIVGTHLTSFMNAMATRMWLHESEQVMYVLGGVVFCLPLLAAEPLRWRPPYLMRLLVLFFAMAPDTIVGIVLLQTPTNMFPARALGRPSWAPGVVDDQHIGGALMWVGGDGLMMLFLVAVIIAYLKNSATNATAGTWLEGVRHRTLAAHLPVDPDTDGTLAEDDVEVDEDDRMHEAYNRMLARMNGKEL